MKKSVPIFFLLFLVLGSLAGIGRAQVTPPFYGTIMNIMGPLEYSGVPVMAKPQTSLTVDFAGRQWTLHNVHEYDSQGRIILEEGRFGLCAELATFMFEKIRPLLDGRYEVKFAMVSEAGFFAAGQSNHIVLLLADKTNGQLYLIDPSFHKYALARDLPEYRILSVQDTLSFVKDQSHDVSFGVDQAIPLYIKKDFLLTFAVTSVDGKFDKGNFIFVISANERNKFAGHDIVLIGRRNKGFVDYEDKALLEALLSQEEIKVLFDKIKIWIQGV